MTLPDASSTMSRPLTNALTTVALEKSYRSTEPPTKVLNGIDLTVRQGEFLAVMGASGSGKSTLLYCISGMDRPTKGSVRLGDVDLTDLSDREMSHTRLTRMGFIFQQAYFLSNFNVRDNILLAALKAQPKGRVEVEARVDAMLERFGIAHVAEHGITQVSGGQLQRASICRALATRPSVVFADEPTGSLNSSMTQEVMDALTDVHRDGTTVMMVTHDPACAARADRVVYLRDGLIVDERDLGAWQPADAGRREDELLTWLRAHDF
ncbi:putative ABC transport system ATP-binding protein [Clavibacter michiganensis]|uniref:ABC transporter ATP-binding protein n=1 Tax=Clavibacter michiganensis TaxID=28447 RepID=UPI001E0997C7|nr:ABC transporter ATP-binding protein [Clavibacter michiganensis]MBM7411141.1 putative ABC transport system ATP-binding protein [Clavibacter michiganensis]